MFFYFKSTRVRTRVIFFLYNFPLFFILQHKQTNSHSSVSLINYAVKKEKSCNVEKEGRWKWGIHFFPIVEYSYEIHFWCFQALFVPVWRSCEVLGNWRIRFGERSKVSSVWGRHVWGVCSRVWRIFRVWFDLHPHPSPSPLSNTSVLHLVICLMSGCACAWRRLICSDRHCDVQPTTTLVRVQHVTHHYFGWNTALFFSPTPPGCLRALKDNYSKMRH